MIESIALPAAKSDARLKADVLSEFAWDPYIRGSRVEVAVRSGVVTVTGQADSLASRIAITEAAHRVQGVLDVVDDMSVAPSDATVRSDDELAHAVREALRWDAYLPDGRITSTVSGGTVTLGGTVEEWPARMDAERVVQRLAGVRGVVNRIAVNAVSVDPVAIKMQIERALERRAEREARKIAVTVKDGIVTLTGPVPSWADRQVVERIAGSAPGIRGIDDRLTIEPYA